MESPNDTASICNTRVKWQTLTTILPSEPALMSGPCGIAGPGSSVWNLFERQTCTFRAIQTLRRLSQDIHYFKNLD